MPVKSERGKDNRWERKVVRLRRQMTMPECIRDIEANRL
jgi:hypothetical protein